MHTIHTFVFHAAQSIFKLLIPLKCICKYHSDNTFLLFKLKCIENNSFFLALYILKLNVYVYLFDSVNKKQTTCFQNLQRLEHN